VAESTEFLYIFLGFSYGFGIAVLIQPQLNGNTLAWPYSQTRKNPLEPDKIRQDNDRLEGHYWKDAKELVWDSSPGEWKLT